MNKCYLYRHIRLDKNEPFYIGIGENKNILNYKRAYNKRGRSYAWKDIAYKIGYEVEIVLDKLTWEEACLRALIAVSSSEDPETPGRVMLLSRLLG